MQIYDFVCKLPRKQVGMNITFFFLGRLNFLLLDINKNPQCLTEDIADFFLSWLLIHWDSVKSIF